MAREFINKYKTDDNALENLKQELSKLIDTYSRSMKDIFELIAFKSRFYQYSARNTMLIMKQNQNCTFTASYKLWKDMGYNVMKGQHGLKILTPVTVTYFRNDEEVKKISEATPQEKQRIQNKELETWTVQRYRIGNVFDISQTDCPVEDYPKIYNMGYSSEHHSMLVDVVTEYAKAHGFTVEEKDLQSISLSGFYQPETEEIVLNTKLKDTKKLSTLTHELGHGLLHSIESDMKAAEFEADIFSYLTHKYFGLDIPEYRISHMQGSFSMCNQNSEFDMMASLDKAGRAYKAFREEIDPAMKQLLQPEINQSHEHIQEQDL